MKGSIQIARLFRIPVFLHWSFSLLVGYLFYLGHSRQYESPQLIWLFLLTGALYLCIVLHEYGHALMARRYGVETKDIIILPIGGLARLERLPEKPFQEFMVAIAGPLVNVAIALVLSPILFLNDLSLIGGEGPSTEFQMMSDYRFFVPALVFLNLTLAIFNLIPAFPMDGGRILRALLSMKLGRYKATRAAVYIGQGIAALMVAGGLWFESYSFPFIGVFIFYTASQERKWVRKEDVLSRFKVADVMRVQFTKVYPEHTIQQVFDWMLRNGERNFLVFHQDGRLAGTLSEGLVLELTKKMPPDTRVADVSIHRFQAVSIEDPLKEINEKMHGSGAAIFPVLLEGEVVGVVDSEALERVVSMGGSSAA